MAGTGKIFISYRREDASGDARSIYQRLQRTIPVRQLFMDVDTIQKGRDFRKVLDEHLSQCQLMLAIIGPQWQRAQDGTGHRLDDPDDFVRMEVVAALKRDIAVIPVRVGGARMPRNDELPEDLKPLLFRQAAIVTYENFARDMDGLERDIRSVLGRPRRWAIAAALVAAIALMAVAAAAHQFGDRVREWGLTHWSDPKPGPESKRVKGPPEATRESPTATKTAREIAQSQGNFNNFQNIGCNYNPSEKHIWLAAIALNARYLDPRIYQDEFFIAIVEAGDSEI